MKINVLFFGATADLVGAKDSAIDVAENATPSSVVDHLASKHPPLKIQRLLFAVNQSYVDGGASLSEGDELAIFTPVSGG